MSLRRLLHGLYVMADDALADRIIKSERIKRAQARIELYEGHEQHMCLHPVCPNPVAGKWIFGHCERHLTTYERNWLQEEFETKGLESTSDETEHPTVSYLRKLNAEQRLELVKQLAERKKQALADARLLVEAARLEADERRAWMRTKLP